MPATPSEGGEGREHATVAVLPESYSVTITEWTDGQVNVDLTFTSQKGKYHVHLTMAQLLGVANDLFKAVIEVLSRQRKGR